MLTLGIESTAHTFGASVVESDIDKKDYKKSTCKILSNEKDSYTTTTGGMIPRELAEHHYACSLNIIKSALEKAKVNLSEIDLVSFSQGPGIGNALRVGAISARQVALKNNIPLIGVNHCVAHIEIGRKLCNAKDPIMLYASGANTQIICYENSYYRVFGETLDTGIGNFLDTFGRELGLGFPAGPKLDEMYFKGTLAKVSAFAGRSEAMASPRELLELPYTVKGMDLAFSGLLTSATKKIEEVKKGKINQEDLVYSVLHNAFAMLTEVTERALAHTEKKEVVLGGGVGCSKALQEMVKKMCDERGAKLFIPPNSVMVDNAAQIGWLGLLMYSSGVRTPKNKLVILPKQRTDDVKVVWRKN
ncbi:MAG: KEOPS complex N(6)-L-threonylcarbamoyladenine synthase Kae1 [Candidatus ainarchaeum sp.]|jgi:glycoprotease/Kae1 family metallohydrolase|nr:KEOPS complex N(6)-L-threonylcarbamoyladenine synthase Kae1 [Candidatus ainarchaeum sp.]MDD4128262.1 KEOPS complex N(6)-L-threonylcarbamoyladenine synthase Kae1 [Candidatus ainarchaeum sp.]MDD4468048.1 KEOPS complex N(6)-L-threonylcarbamoyladenine synthase Kae1 [Candidatus ainarchaeum sp.]HPM85509.1 KEOPS complex N(6)-L-threonylcarbamoyladenine synthase Kae1 [archaeon]